MLICPYCGEKVAKGLKRCSNCGEYLNPFYYLLSKINLFLSYFLTASIPYGLLTYMMKDPNSRSIVSTLITSIFFGLIMATFFVLFYHRKGLIESKSPDLKEAKYKYPKLLKKIYKYTLFFWPIFIFIGFIGYKYNAITPNLFYMGIYTAIFMFFMNVIILYNIIIFHIVTNDIGITAKYPFEKERFIKWDEITSIETPRAYGIKSRENKRIIKTSDPKKKISFDVSIEGYTILMKTIEERMPNKDNI